MPVLSSGSVYLNDKMDPKGFVNYNMLHKCKALLSVLLPVTIDPCNPLTNDGFKTYHF